jgi:hypothetical protein
MHTIPDNLFLSDVCTSVIQLISTVILLLLSC